MIVVKSQNFQLYHDISENSKQINQRFRILHLCTLLISSVFSLYTVTSSESFLVNDRITLLMRERLVQRLAFILDDIHKGR